MSSPYELLVGLALLREKKRLADTSNDTKLESWSALLVRLGEEICVLRQNDVDEIIAQGKLNKVNGVEPWVLGLGYFRGRLLSVLDGKRLFDLHSKPRSTEAAARVLVIGGDEDWFGFRVDELIGIRHVWSDNMDVKVTPGAVESPWSGYIERWVKIENDTVPVLQIKQLVLELEHIGKLGNKK